MRKNKTLFRSLAVLLTILLFCSTFMTSGSIQTVWASSSVPDQAVTFIKTDYQNYGAENDLSVHYPYVAYVLNSAGVSWKAWNYNGVTLEDAVAGIVDTDINNSKTPVKYLAQDLILMQTMGDTARASQLENLLQTRQLNNGTFQDDTNVYSIIPAYELLGRANKLSIVDTAYAQAYILGQQSPGSGAWVDFMDTAQAVRALNYLAPGAAADSMVGQAISKGCSWMKLQQQADGSFKTTFDDALIDTAEAIAAQKALGLDSASAWTSGGKSAVDYLMSNSLNSDGSFGGSKNVMDAAWALDSFALLNIFPSGGGSGNLPTTVNVRVQVEGASANLADTTVSVAGTALDALKTAAGSDQVVAPGGFVSSIKGESGRTGAAADTDTSWFFYVIRSGSIDPASLSSGAGSYNVQEGDRLIFYIGAYGHTTYAPMTYYPIVSISPQLPSAGRMVTISISAKKYDWMSGLQDLSSGESAAIGNYTVVANGTTYTSQYGQVTIPGVAAGSLSYRITSYNLAGYPNVVPYLGSISVTSASSIDVSQPKVDVGVAVVGIDGELLFGPNYLSVSADNKWGKTVLGTLDATELSYTTSKKHPGFVEAVEGQSNSGQQGWMFTLNGNVLMESAKDAAVENNDKVIWYYSTDMNQAAPTWDDLMNRKQLIPVYDTSGEAAVYPEAGGTVGLGTEALVIIPPDALAGISPVKVTVGMLATPPPAPSGFVFLGKAYEFTIDDKQSYTFAGSVTLRFQFNPSDLLPGQKPAIYYYDDAASRWVELGGTVSGNTITVSVDHFTRFAVLVNQVQVPLAPTVNFSDLSEQHWAKAAISALVSKSAVAGYPDGTFKPEKNITRAEFISILNKALQLSDYTPSSPDFSDVSSQDWFYSAVENALHAGISKGDGRSFNPNRNITREELAVILVNALGRSEAARAAMNNKTGFTDDGSISSWARGFVDTAVGNNLMKGYPDNRFNSQGKATRAEACAAIVNLMNTLNPVQK